MSGLNFTTFNSTVRDPSLTRAVVFKVTAASPAPEVANTSKALAYTLDFITDETVATRIPVFFNGVNGIGTP